MSVFQTVNVSTPGEALASAALAAAPVLIGAAVVVWLVLVILRALWRRIRGISPSQVARGAGAITGRAHKTGRGFWQDFKDGFRNG